MEVLDGKYIANSDKNSYVKIYGEGDQTIVLEPDLGGLTVEWEYIQREVGKFATVLSYDRSGYGESPKSNFDRSLHQN